MRYLLVFAVLFSVIGCGSVDAMKTDDAGTGGTGGALATGGTGGDPMTVDGGAADSGHDAGCTPTACTTCVNGASVPVTDGTSCGTDMNGAQPPSCAGLVGSDYRCAAGSCMQAVRLDCGNSGMFSCTSANERGCGTPTPACASDNPAGTAAAAATVQCVCGGSTSC